MSNSNSRTTQKLRNYVFTLHLKNIYQVDDDIATRWVNEEFLQSLPENENMKFIVFQLEKSESGSYHLQGYVELTKPQRIVWIRNHWREFGTTGGNSVWLHARDGDRSEAINYCKKEESRISGPWTYGQDNGQGHRSDVVLVATAILGGASEEDILRNHPTSYLLHCKNVKTMIYDVCKTRHVDWNPCVIVFCGDSNTGKTFTIKKLAGPKAYYYICGQHNSSWWDGYTGQEDIVFNDWGKGAISVREFQNLWDNGVQVQVKGGTTRLMPKRVWISSNFDPVDWYDKVEDLNRKSIYRRIDYCFCFAGDYDDATVTVRINTKPNTVRPEVDDEILIYCGQAWLPRTPHQFAPKDLVDRVPYNPMVEARIENERIIALNAESLALEITPTAPVDDDMQIIINGSFIGSADIEDCFEEL